MDSAWNLIILPLGLGLLGFIEPCTVGSSLLFIRYLEGKPARVRIVQAITFTVTRALFIGALGAVAASVGTVSAGFRQTGWLILGSLYLGLDLSTCQAMPGA
jgi:cytochrome c-type biogenesis protein